MLISTLIITVVALGLMILAHIRGLLWQGVKASSAMLYQVLPLLILSFVVAGFIQVLLPREMVMKFLGKESGFKGILLGCVFGAITPGGPITCFPIVAAVYKAGASIGTAVAFVTSWSLLAVNRLPIEIGLIGPRFMLVRLASTFFFPPIAGLIAQKLFS